MAGNKSERYSHSSNTGGYKYMGMQSIGNAPPTQEEKMAYMFFEQFESKPASQLNLVPERSLSGKLKDCNGSVAVFCERPVLSNVITKSSGKPRVDICARPLMELLI